jgi:hypothetical protein
MTHHHAAHDQERPGGNLLSVRMALVLIGFIVIAGFLLFSEHRAHALGVLIYLPLLLCPLMHLFMHGGHGHHGRTGPQDGERSSP